MRLSHPLIRLFGNFPYAVDLPPHLVERQKTNGVYHIVGFAPELRKWLHGTRAERFKGLPAVYADSGRDLGLYVTDFSHLHKPRIMFRTYWDFLVFTARWLCTGSDSSPTTPRSERDDGETGPPLKPATNEAQREIPPESEVAQAIERLVDAVVSPRPRGTDKPARRNKRGPAN